MKKKPGNTQLGQKSRKELRKEKRQLKKARKKAFSLRKQIPSLADFRKEKEDEIKAVKKKERTKRENARKKKVKKRKMERLKQEEEEKKKEAFASVKKEEKEIRRLEKQLKISKKRASLPASFHDDGLSYILEAIDSANQKDDLAEQEIPLSDEESEISSDIEGPGDYLMAGQEEVSDEDNDIDKESDDIDNESDDQENELKVVPGKSILKRRAKDQKESCNPPKKVKWTESLAENQSSETGSSQGGGEEEEESEEDSENDEPELKEDIYGRLRDKEGKVVSSGAYVPPAKRATLEGGSDKRSAVLERLRKQMKGLINRASEASMEPVSSQIEDLYMSNSRADVNETLTSLILEACVAPVLTPERLAQELAMLVAILHGNVGSEVGAYFVHTLTMKWKFFLEEPNYGEGKYMENVSQLLCHIYCFKMINHGLLFDVMRKFVESFGERDIEILLVILKTAGFSLRKDDPVALKDFVVQAQDKASKVDTSQFENPSRVNFMLDIILAIKNNNMRKIPNYDPDHLQHLIKLARKYIRGSGLAHNQLCIGLEDLLQADQQGRWWLVGSAWQGRDQQVTDTEKKSGTKVPTPGKDKKLLELARQQRMNTDLRRSIFCLVMASEDYIDAFQKLLALGLKEKQERDIVYVIVDCCQQEKSYNPFYAYLMQKFCEFDRRFQRLLQFHLWEKFENIHHLTKVNQENLAALIAQLVLKQGLSLAILRGVDFAALSKNLMHFMSHLLKLILMCDDLDTLRKVFARIACLAGLKKMLSDLRVFIDIFIVKKSKDAKLLERAQIARNILEFQNLT